ncbi:MAG: hypothetical protein IPL61_07435 [Myxococcales bacterium]|nr:hypothetical protein [Myxococcales bacterium]
MLDLSGWEPLTVPVAGDLRDASREQAAAAFAALHDARAQRIAALTALAARHDVALAGDDAAERLGAWLVTAAAAAGPEAIGGAVWTGLAADVTLWLGERVIAASGGALRWDLYTAHKKATGYQRAVLVGFAGVDDPRYYVDLAHFVASWLELALRRRPARPDFLAVIARTTLADAGPR